MDVKKAYSILKNAQSKWGSIEEDEAFRFILILLESIEKWGLGDLDIEELNNWRSRMVWHVRHVAEGKREDGKL